MECLRKEGLGAAASGALQSICSACPAHMASHFQGLRAIASSLDQLEIGNEASIGLLKGEFFFILVYTLSLLRVCESLHKHYMFSYKQTLYTIIPTICYISS